MKKLSKEARLIIVALAAVCLAVSGFAVWHMNHGFFHEGDEAKVRYYLRNILDESDPDAPVYRPDRGYGEEKWQEFLENTAAGERDHIIIALYYTEGVVYTYLSYKDGKYYTVWDNSDDLRGGTISTGEYLFTELKDHYYSDYCYSKYDKKGWFRHIHTAWLSDDPDFDPDDHEGVRHFKLFNVVDSEEEVPLEEIPLEERK